MMNRSPSRAGPAARMFAALTLALVTLTGTAGEAKPKPPITAASNDAFWWGDFAALEQQNALYRQPGRFGADGASQLSQFRAGMAKVFNANVTHEEPYLTELDNLTLQWAKQYPRSALAHILHARALLAHGQSYRGGSWAKDVPPEAWEFYHRYLRQAAGYLKDHADVALTDSYAHYVLISIGQGLDWDDKQVQAIAEDGLRRNPEDADIPSVVANTLLPKWGGNAKDLDTYIRHATEQSRARLGWGMYAKLYSEAMEDQYGSDLFEDSHADWDKMKQGYEDLLARYPKSAAQRNRYAYIACIAKDKPTLLRLLGEISSKVDTGQWGHNAERALETCRRWASQT